MTGDEHQAQKVVADVIVEGSVEIFHQDLASTHLAGIEFATEFLVLALEPRVSAEVINRAMLGSRHKPSARVVRDARLRPLFERGNESILCKILGHTDIAHDPRQPGDEPRRLDPPDCVDRTMCIGSRHSYRSHHL